MPNDDYFSSKDSVYCYPDSTVLRNKLNIRSQSKLDAAESKLVVLRINELTKHPLDGGFDLNHLCSIHRYLFQDIYEWAGEIRTVDIARDIPFCYCTNIAPTPNHCSQSCIPSICSVM